MLYTAEMPTAPPGFHALVAGHRGAVLADPSGAVENLSAKAALKRLSDGPRPLVCHAPSTFLRLGAGSTAAFDLLELFAFVRPARFCRPTPSGIAEALLLDEPQGAEQEALSLQRAAEALLAELAEPEFDREVAAETAREMGNWIWTPHVLRVLEAETPSVMGRAPGLHAWRRIEEWSEHAPTAPPGNQPVSAEDARRRLALLDEWEAELDRVYSGEPSHPVMVALQDVVRRAGIPAEPLRDLIEANRMDQGTGRFETYADLLHYCAHSANPVGRVVLRVLGEATEENVRLSDATCSALQLANFWQDVARDYRMGRVYIPQEDMSAFGCREERIAEGIADGAFRRLMRFEVDRAEALFAEGAPLARRLRGRAGLAVDLFGRGGRRVLDAIREQDYDVLSKRPVVTRPRKAFIALAAALRMAPPRRA